MTATNLHKQRERGFGVVGFLVLLPFLISVLATIAGAALLFKADAHLKHECRTSILNSQRQVAEKLRDLMTLNPEAEELRAQLAEAKEELEAAEESAQPELIAVAEAHFLYVESQSYILKARQQALVLSGRALSVEAPLKAKSAVLSGLSQEASTNGVSLPGTRSSSRFGKFDVVATPEGEITPDYQPSPQFTAKQTIDVDVQVELGSLLPAWLRALLPNQGLEINSHCQATIEQQEDQWIETLNAVR